MLQEHLLKLGNVQQSPVDFLNKRNSENGLLVIIKNKDIAGHIHKVFNVLLYFCFFLSSLLLAANEVDILFSLSFYCKNF